jgi:pimeloyl-ACP methyl ester carboxylesterase
LTVSKASEKFVEVDGIKTFYFTLGSGPALILVHGDSPGVCSSVTWQQNIGPLADAGFTVYAVDQPGFGRSDNPTDASMDYRVRHIGRFADTLGLDRFHMVGSSRGAYVAAKMGLQDKRTQGVVLVSSSTIAPRGGDAANAVNEAHRAELRQYTPTLENARTLTQGTLYNQALVTDALVEERYRMSTGKNFEAQKNRWAAPNPKSLVDALPSLKNPTLILWGHNDRGAAVERALLLFKLIPGAELHIFDRCAHWVQWDKADPFNTMVPAFLKRIGNSARL